MSTAQNEKKKGRKEGRKENDGVIRGRDRGARYGKWGEGGGEGRGRGEEKKAERLPPSGNFCLKLEFLCGSLGLGMQIGGGGDENGESG